MEIKTGLVLGLPQKSILKRIQNNNNTQWVDTNSNNVALYLNPSMGESGEYSLGRNHFKLRTIRTYAPVNNSYTYNIETKNDGSIDIELSDSQLNNELGYSPFEKYSFDYFYRNNPNQVARKKDIEMAITGFLNEGEIEI